MTLGLQASLSCSFSGAWGGPTQEGVVSSAWLGQLEVVGPGWGNKGQEGLGWARTGDQFDWRARERAPSESWVFESNPALCLPWL